MRPSKAGCKHLWGGVSGGDVDDAAVTCRTAEGDAALFLVPHHRGYGALARAAQKHFLGVGKTHSHHHAVVIADSDDILGKMKVSALLEALPGVGKVRAQQIMERLEIATSRRLRGLGDRQRKALLSEFGTE